MFIRNLCGVAVALVMCLPQVGFAKEDDKEPKVSNAGWIIAGGVVGLALIHSVLDSNDKDDAPDVEPVGPPVTTTATTATTSTTGTTGTTSTTATTATTTST